jgi:hypothetical protein
MPQLNTSAPVSSFLNSSTEEEMRDAAQILTSAELDEPQYNIHSSLTFVDITPAAKVFGGVIPDNACSNSNAENIFWGNSVTSIENYAFSYCFGFTGSLTIPNSVTSIGSYAFYGCSFTGSLTIGDSVTSIGNGAFQYCSGFTGSLTIGDSVTSIGSGAFNNCSGFTGSLTIGDSVTSIENYAFLFCSGFTGSLTIPNSVTSIGSYAFYSCSGFTGDLTIGDSVTSIGSSAFFYCSGFTGSLTIPNSVTSIGDYAFYSCSNIDTVYVNVNASVVASNAFYSSGVTQIYYKSGTTGWTDPWNGIPTAVWTSWPDPM